MKTEDKNNTGACRGFSDTIIGSKIYHYNSVDSTNSEAKRKSDAPSGTVFVSDVQTCGRGRLGREWFSDDKGLWFSILLRPRILPQEVFQITLVAGLAVSKAIEGAKIKWPNDIILNNKKVCGILTEMSTENNDVKYVVVGIGVNVHTEFFPESIKDVATSIRLETGNLISKKQLLSDICFHMNKYYKLFEANGFEAIRDEYKNSCITVGKDVLIKCDLGDYSAHAVDVDSLGQLVVKTLNSEKKVLSGEVSVRGLLGYI